MLRIFWNNINGLHGVWIKILDYLYVYIKKIIEHEQGIFFYGVLVYALPWCVNLFRQYRSDELVWKKWDKAYIKSLNVSGH